MRIEDVDGTVPGRAALTGVRLDTDRPAQMHQLLIEGPDCPDPSLSACALRDSVAADWPEHVLAVAQNERARFLMAQRRMTEALGGWGSQTPAEYVAGR